MQNYEKVKQCMLAGSNTEKSIFMSKLGGGDQKRRESGSTGIKSFMAQMQARGQAK